MDVDQSSAFRRAFRYFSRYAKPDMTYVLWVIVAVLGLTATNTALVWMIGLPFDYIQAGRFDEVKELLLWLMLVVLINQALHMSSALGANWLGLRFVGRVRQAAMRHVLHVSAPGTAHLQRGDLLARLGHDTDKVQDMVLEVPFHLISHLLTMLFYSAMLFWINWQMALVALLFVPLFYLHQRLFGPYKRRASDKFYQENGDLQAFEEQALANLRGISSVRAENRIADRHGRAFEMARRWAMRMRSLDQGFDVTLAALIYLCGVTIVFFGLGLIQASELSAGALVSFLIYLGYLSVPVRGFAQAPMQFHGNLGAAQRVLALFELKAETEDMPDAVPLNVIQRSIRFDGVSFAYAGGPPVLDNVDLEIRDGEVIALVGGSGAGKSAFARLLMRFYDPQLGRILVSGQDIRGVTLSSLRNSFCATWQDSFILNDTIRANLLLAAPMATEGALVAACRMSGAWVFIRNLERRLDARIGSGGVELSGGQYQRLAIAQALLADSPFFILDEATSALDSQSEKRVVEALETLRRGRTTIIIAHRYSLIQHADRVVYFNGDGSITTGTHDELVCTHPEYQAAAAWQSKSKAQVMAS